MNYTEVMANTLLPQQTASASSEGVEGERSLEKMVELHQQMVAQSASLILAFSEALTNKQSHTAGASMSPDHLYRALRQEHLLMSVQESLTPTASWRVGTDASTLAAAGPPFGDDEPAKPGAAAVQAGDVNVHERNYNAADEVEKLAALEQDVEALKQQVAALTGLLRPSTRSAPDPLAAARRRGSSYMKTQFESADSLTLAAASEYSGRADRVLNLERRNGSLYALILEGNTRGFRYPKWQFDVPATRLRPLLQLLAAGAMSCWAIHNFLTRPHADLAGESPANALGNGTIPLERILDVARRRIDPDQGAP